MNAIRQGERPGNRFASGSAGSQWGSAERFVGACRRGCVLNAGAPVHRRGGRRHDRFGALGGCEGLRHGRLESGHFSGALAAAMPVSITGAAEMSGREREIRIRLRTVACATTWRRYCEMPFLYPGHVLRGVTPCLMWRDDAIGVDKKVLLSGYYSCLLSPNAEGREEIDGLCPPSASLFSDNGEIES